MKNRCVGIFINALAIWTVLGVLILVTAGVAVAQGEPILRIETKEHGAIILGLAVSADGTHLATASNDRTVRMWSLPALEPARTIHLPVGSDLEGAVYAVSFSPDGKKLVTTGYTGAWGEDRNPDGRGPWCFYVIDVSAADITQTVCDLPRVGNHLAFSKDGQHMAVALARGFGVQIYRTTDFTLVARDADYNQQRTQFVEFDSTGRLGTTSFDGQVRLYDQSFRLVAKSRMPENRRPDGLSFSPDGSQIAVAYNELGVDGKLLPPAIDVLSSSDLSPLFRPDLGGIENGALRRVAWSADGQSLYAAGSWRRDNQYYVRRWSGAGRGRPVDIAAGPQPIIRIAALAAGGLVYTAEIPYLGVIGADGTQSRRRMSALADYTAMGQKFAISQDGNAVQFAFEAFGARLAHFSFKSSQSSRLKSGVAPNTMVPPTTEHSNLDIRNWVKSSSPTLNGALLPLRKDEITLSLAIAPDGKSFVLGTAWRLIRFDGKGTVMWDTHIPYNAFGLVTSPDNRMVVAALGDGTIRWFTMDAGKEVVALFPHPDGKRWVTWTPAGYYMASVGGDELIGWQVNRGRERAASFFNAGQFRRILNRPDIVLRTLAELDEAKAVRAAGVGFTATDKRTVDKFVKAEIAKRQPPIVRVDDPKDNDLVSGSEITVKYTVRSPSGLPVKVFAQIDGQLVSGATSGRLVVAAGKEKAGTLKVKVPQHEKINLAVIAETESQPILQSENALQTLRRAPALTTVAPPKLPILYALTVGIGRYKSIKSLEPNFPAQDIDRIANSLKSQRGLAFSRVEFFPHTAGPTLKDRDATARKIKEGLSWLKRQGKDSDPENILLFYFLGHGEGSHLLAHDYETANQDDTAISKYQLIDYFRDTNTKVIIFIDACQAAEGFEVDDFVNAAKSAKNGIISVLASASDQLAWGEASSYFTAAVLEAMKGEGLPASRNEIWTADLDSHLNTKFRKLFEQQKVPQIPSVNKLPRVQHLLIAKRLGR